MSGEFIEVLSPKALADLNKANAELVTMVKNVEKINQQFKSVTIPSASDNTIKDTNAELVKQQKVIQQLEKQIKSLTAVRAQSNKRTSEEIVNQRALAQAADRETRANSQLVGAYSRLTAQRDIARKRLQDLIASGERNNQTLRAAQREYDRLENRVRAANDATRQFNYNVGNYRSAFGGLATSLRSLMTAFGLVGGIFLFAQAIRGAFNSIKEFDKANADLAATMGVTRKEMNALTKDAIRLGGSTKFTATEVSKLQKEFAKLGFSQREILNATEATLNLAAAVDTDLANAANIAGATLRGFGLDASEMNRITDVMAKSFTSSALDIDNFRESMKYVAPIAKATGVSVEFATAMLGKLADAGIRGSQAGTSLRRILTEMAKTGKPAAEAFDMVAKSGISVKDAMDEVGRTAQTALLVLAESKDGVMDLKTALDAAGGSAEKMAKEQLKSLQGEITLLTSAWDGFIQSLNNGDGALGNALKKAIEYSREIVKAWQYAFSNDQQRNEMIVNDIKQARALELRNEVLKRVNETEQKLISTRRQIANLERNIKADPNNQALRNELKLLQEREATLQAIYKGQAAAISDNAKRRREELIESAKAFESEALKLQERNRVLREEFNQEGVSLRRKQLINQEIRKNQEEIQRLNNNIKVHNEGIKEMNKLVKEQAGALKEVNEEETNLNETKKESNKIVQDQITYLEGTEAHYKQQISDLQKIRSETAKTSAEYQQFTKDIEQLEYALKQLQGAMKDIAEFDGDGLKLDFESMGLSASEFEKFRSKTVEEIQKAGDAWQETFRDWADVSQDAIRTVEMAMQGQFDRQLNRLQQQRDIAILFAGESAEAREEIERQYDEKRKAILQRQARQDKAFAIMNSIINTAQAVIASLARTPPPAGIPLAAAVGAIGVAQTAIIASQQIPQFYKGTENAPEGWAWTQEKGREVITDKHGNIKDTGSTGGAKLTYLNKGDKVYTAQETKKLMFDDNLNRLLMDNGINSGVVVNNDFAGLESKMDNLISVVRSKESAILQMDKAGFEIYTAKENEKRKQMNNRLRIRR